MKIKILFLAANPLDIDRLRLDEEVRAIDQALRQGDYRDRYIMQPHLAVRVEDLQELLLRHQPDIVHFSGHGTAANEIILQDANGKGVPVSGVALSNLFRLFKENISCVVLNACYSVGQAQAIAQHIPVVIGMSDAIPDDASINFAAAFYRALGYGRTVQESYDLGCNQVELAGLADAEKPQLVTERANPAQITIPANPLRAGDHHLWALLTVIPLVVLAYYLFQMLYRWIYIDLEFLNFVAILLQIIAGLLAFLGVSTTWGQEVVRDLWGRIVSRFPQLRHTRLVFMSMAGLALAVVITFHIASPVLARHHNARGLNALETGQYTGATTAFRHAINLAPTTGRYHYNAGLAAEGAGDYPAAMAAYQRAFTLENDFWPAYNNLGRLYLLPNYSPNPAEALRVLTLGLTVVDRLARQSDQPTTDTLLAYGVLHKNIGWAYLAQAIPEQALDHLLEAEKQLEQLEAQSAYKGVAWLYLAETYAHLARAYEALPQPNLTEAQRAWGNSQGYALLIPETDICQAYGGLGNAYCIDARIWAEEAARQYSNP